MIHRITIVLAVVLLAGYTLSAQQVVVDTLHKHTHDHDSSMHNHGNVVDHDHLHNHDHDHDHGHDHVHDHGVGHSHDEFTIAAFGTQASHNASFNSLPPVENCCTGFTNSKGLGFGIEVSMTTPISSDGFTITPHIGYQNMPVSFESYSKEKAFTGGVVSGDALFQHTLDVAWSVVTFGARIEYPLIDGFYLGAGLDGNFFATGSFHQTETLLEPSNLVFETGTRTRLDRNGYLRGQHAIVFNATGSARIRLVEKRPGAVGVDIFGRYSLPLQSLYSPQTWKGRYGNPPATYFIDSYSITMLTAGLGIVF
ncbi:MAG: hypothetical protein ACK5BQ_08590 [Ignavibacteria bacterium]|jgi:hypothetical protein